MNFKVADGGDDDKEGGEAKRIDSVFIVVVTFLGEDGLKVASDMEKKIFAKIKKKVQGSKKQGRKNVDRDVYVVEGLMYSLVRDGMSVFENNKLLNTGAYAFGDRFWLMYKKKENFDKKKLGGRGRLKRVLLSGRRIWLGWRR